MNLRRPPLKTRTRLSKSALSSSSGNGPSIHKVTAHSSTGERHAAFTRGLRYRRADKWECIRAGSPSRPGVNNWRSAQPPDLMTRSLITPLSRLMNQGLPHSRLSREGTVPYWPGAGGLNLTRRGSIQGRVSGYHNTGPAAECRAFSHRVVWGYAHRSYRQCRMLGLILESSIYILRKLLAIPGKEGKKDTAMLMPHIWSIQIATRQYNYGDPGSLLVSAVPNRVRIHQHRPFVPTPPHFRFSSIIIR